MLQNKYKYLKYKQKYLDLKKLLGGYPPDYQHPNYQYVHIWNEKYWGIDDFRPFDQRSEVTTYDSDSDYDDEESHIDRQLSKASTVLIDAEDGVEKCYFEILSFHLTIESAESAIDYDIFEGASNFGPSLMGNIIYPENYTYNDLMREKRGYWLSVWSDNLPPKDTKYGDYKVINIKLHFDKADAEAEVIISNGTKKMHKDEIRDLHNCRAYDGEFHE
jgi:hypothetical protein